MSVRVKQTVYDEATGKELKVSDYVYAKYAPKDGINYAPKNCKSIVIRSDRLEGIFTVPSDWMKLLTLCNYISSTNNHLHIRSQSGAYRAMRVEDMERLFDTTTRAVKEFLNRMKKLGIIRKINIPYTKTAVKSYVVNPYFINATHKVTAEQYFLFEEFFKTELTLEDKIRIYDLAGTDYRNVE